MKLNEGETKRITFKYDWGKPVEGKYGPQLCFGLEGDDAFYINQKSPFLNELISLKPLKGKTIEIGKHDGKFFLAGQEESVKQLSTEEILRDMAKRLDRIENELNIKEVPF